MGFTHNSEAGGPKLVPPRPDHGSDVSSASTDLPRTGDPLPSAPVHDAGSPVWLRRFAMLVQVVFFIWMGSILIVLPWRLMDLWLNTPFVATRPELHAALGNYFVRGMITGLGAVDIWFGIWTAVNYRDHK